MDNRIQLKKFQINQELKKHKRIKPGILITTSNSSLNNNNIKKNRTLSKQKNSQKISINNINVNANNLNLNTSFGMNVNLCKRINTVSNSPKRTNLNIIDNRKESNSNLFDKNVLNDLRNQFFEITKKKKPNLNKSNINILDNSFISLGNTQKDLQLINKNKSHEKKHSKSKLGKKSLNLFDSLKNNFLNQNINNINNKNREKSKEQKPINKTEYCETENFSSLEENYLNQTNTYDKTRNLRIETNPNTNTNTNTNTNESLQIREIFLKYHNEIKENNKLKRENFELIKWINILKNIIINQNNNFIKKIKIREIYHINREKALIKENNSLKKIIINSFDAIKIFDKISYEYDQKLNRNYSQILTENECLRKIFLNNNLNVLEKENKNNQRRINHFSKINHYHNNNRSITKVKVDKKEENQEKTKLNYKNTITQFSNSNIYLNQTMKKEMINNINFQNFKNKKNQNSNSTSNIISQIKPYQNQNKIFHRLPKIKYKK